MENLQYPATGLIVLSKGGVLTAEKWQVGGNGDREFDSVPERERARERRRKRGSNVGALTKVNNEVSHFTV